ncbi:hypothetical protein [Gemmatimonas sp. UBA7669]|uniref:hypothetical protein n=1 Tax=Gemmatimonas sp. UBA7669 TaxID=1946568 RepID=UPI0025BC4BCD|nr:hypothetical protein [Gemmatimonas sp. UBA7669]
MNTALRVQPPRIQAGTLLRPDTVEVGDPFVFVVTVAVPAGATVEWPQIKDSTAVVNMRAPLRIVDEGTKLGTRRERAEYTLSAWDVGRVPIGLSDVTVRVGSSSLRVPLSDARVFVRSVLPGDSTLHVPKPARDLYLREVPWWERWWPALLVLAALALLAWLWRRHKRRKVAAPAAPLLDPYARALHEFDRLDRLSLADAGETGRWTALAVDVLRWYLEARVPAAHLALTSGEVLEAVAPNPHVPHDRLYSLLADVDIIKFAAHPVSAERARRLAGEARAIVEHIEASERATREAARAAADAAARAADAERRAAEEAARRASVTTRSDRRGPPAGVP